MPVIAEGPVDEDDAADTRTERSTCTASDQPEESGADVSIRQCISISSPPRRSTILNVHDEGLQQDQGYYL